MTEQDVKALRDYFAGQALVGVVNYYNPATNEDANDIDRSCQRAAELAYKLADAMLKERGK